MNTQVQLLCVICTISFCMAQFGSFNTKQKFCGSKLTEALAIACRGRYNGLRTMKRDGYIYPNIIEDTDGQSDDDTASKDMLTFFPWNSKENALRMIPSEFRKQKRGVAYECCQKACTFGEMRGYCQ